MSNSQQRIITNLQLAIDYGDLTVSLLQQAKQASSVTRIPFLLYGITSYALHLLYVEAARYAQNDVLCVIETNYFFPIEEYNEASKSYITTATTAFAIFDPQVLSSAGLSLETGYLAGYITDPVLGKNVDARMALSTFELMNFSGTCADAVRAIPGVNLPPYNSQAPTPIGCLEILANPPDGVGVRTHPSFDGRVLGRVNSLSHPGSYPYYATQSDSGFRVIDDVPTATGDGQWYQVAPLGYGVDGYAMWIRESVNSAIYLNILDPNNCSTTPTILQNLNPVTTPEPHGPWNMESGTAGNTVLVLSTNEDVLTYILSCEGAYELGQAKDIAYIIRSRMMSNRFPDTVMEVMKEKDAWHCWGDAIGIQNYIDAINNNVEAIDEIRDQVVRPLLALSQGGLGTLPFAPSEPEFEYGLYTLGDAIYNATPAPGQSLGEVSAYRDNPASNKLSLSTVIQRLRASVTWVSGTCYDVPKLERIYIDHTPPDDSGLITMFFTDYTGCIFDGP